MVDSTPEDFSRSSVGPLARFLMISAREDPSLLRRSRSVPSKVVSGLPGRVQSATGQPASGLPASGGLPGRGMPVGGLPGNATPTRREPFWRETPSASDSYLEELVSIAITSARQADDASRQARTSISRARRGMVAFASVGAVGISIAAADLGGKALLTTTGIWPAEAEAGAHASGGNTTGTAPIEFSRLLPFQLASAQLPESWSESVLAPVATIPPAEPGADASPRHHLDDVGVVETASAMRPAGMEAALVAGPLAQEALPVSPSERVARAPHSEGAGQTTRPAARRRAYPVQYAHYQPSQPPLWRFVATLQRNVTAIFR
jgi:hypothetical protein